MRPSLLIMPAEATFRESGAAQEEIARRLGLPYGSYRRYLTQAVTRIADALWQRAHEQRSAD